MNGRIRVLVLSAVLIAAVVSGCVQEMSDYRVAADQTPMEVAAMKADDTEFPEDELRDLLRKYNVTEDNITLKGLVYTMDELLDLYRKYNITENDLKFAMDELPHYLDGTIFDGKHGGVIATETGEPPKGMKKGVDYDIILSIEEVKAIKEEARERYIAKYGVDTGDMKIDVINGIPFPVGEVRRLVERGLLIPSE